MNVKHIGLCALVVTLLGATAVRAQEPLAAPGPYPAEPFVQGAPPVTGPVDASPSPVPQLSRWITGPPGDCCGPFGGKTIGYEIYLRNGVSIPFGNGVLARDLDVGWVIQGGARVLFFNPAKLAAWTVDLSVSNVNNHADGEHKALLEHIIVPGTPNILGQSTSTVLPSIEVTFHRYNRTFVNAAFGREWYLWDPANSCGSMWRAGVDAGPRYGSSKLELNELPHRTHVIGGVFVSLHTDVEWPCGACIYQAGFRAEWSYTFSEILQDQNNANVHDVMLMLNLGVRF